MKPNIMEHLLSKLAGILGAREAMQGVSEIDTPNLDSRPPETGDGKPAVVPPVETGPRSEGPVVDHGRPDGQPPAETGKPDELPEVGSDTEMFDETTGLPVIAKEMSPDGFPGHAEDAEDEEDSVLDFLFS